MIFSTIQEESEVRIGICEWTGNFFQAFSAEKKNFQLWALVAIDFRLENSGPVFA